MDSTSQVASAMARHDRHGETRQKSMAVGVRAALSQGSPGQWSSDHRTETDKYSGWHYIAIRQMSLQAAQSDVEVFDDSGAKGPVRKALRKKFRNRGISKAAAGSDPLPMAHPLSKILKRPSPTQSGTSFDYERVMQLGLTGNCIVWNVPNKLGLTVERYVIPIAVTSEVRPSPDFPTGGLRVTPQLTRGFVADPDGFIEQHGYEKAINKILPNEQLQIIRWPHPLFKDDGMSPVAASAMWTDTSEQVDSARYFQMKNGPDGSLIVTVPDDWDGDEADLERAAKSFNMEYAGTENTGKAIFVTAGGVTPLSTAPKDMAYDTGFTQLRDAILAIHSTPGVAVGVTDGGSYAAFYASLKQFITLAVQPTLDLLSSEDTEWLAPQFGDNLTIENTAASFDDPAILESELMTDIAGGAILIDEIRELRGRAALPNGEGQKPAGGLSSPQVSYAFSSDVTEDADQSTTGVEGFDLVNDGLPAKSLKETPVQWFDRVSRKSLNGRLERCQK